MLLKGSFQNVHRGEHVHIKNSRVQRWCVSCRFTLHFRAIGDTAIIWPTSLGLKLSHCEPRPFRFLLNWQHLLPSPDAGPLRPRQLRIPLLIQRDRPRSTVAARLREFVAGKQTYRTERQPREAEPCSTQRKGQLFPKQRSRNRGGEGISQVGSGRTCGFFKSPHHWWCQTADPLITNDTQSKKDAYTPTLQR